MIPRTINITRLIITTNLIFKHVSSLVWISRRDFQFSLSEQNKRMAKTKAHVNKCSDLSKKKSALYISDVILSQKRILDNNTMNIHSCSALCWYSEAVEMSYNSAVERSRKVFHLFLAVCFSLL